MKMRSIFPAWGRILQGYKPFLSVEITKECPLRCPGCYAYEREHLNNGHTIRDLRDLKGSELVAGVVALVRRERPLHVSIIGGEPLVRYRELGELIPRLGAMGIEVQLVTSAVRPIPREWAGFSNLHLVVSIDGLREEHDARRAPATYDRILEHISGHKITVHCTITKQMLSRNDCLSEFSRYWSERPEVHKIWFSLYTPQEGDGSGERLTPADRQEVITTLARLRGRVPKVYMPEVVLNGYRRPPDSPSECTFSQVTTCVTADLVTAVTPCQIGGRPVCSECGCLAAAGMVAVRNHKLGGLVPVGDIFLLSQKIGSRVRTDESGSRPSKPRLDPLPET